jgi:hypothetical protein
MNDLLFTGEAKLRQKKGKKTVQGQTWRRDKKNPESKSNRFRDTTTPRTKTNLTNVSQVRAVQNKFLTPSMTKVTVSMPVLIYRNLPLVVNVPSNVIIIAAIMQIATTAKNGRCLLYSCKIQVYRLQAI